VSNSIFENKTYKGLLFTAEPLAKGAYEHCYFVDCTFSNSDLSDIHFSDCVFENCDLSMSTMAKTSYIDVLFKNCKLLGVRFDTCNNLLLSFTFEHCELTYSSFYRLNLKNTHYKSCKLQEVDFAETNLTGVVFDYCDFLDAIFDYTILEKADFRTAQNFSIDPEMNKIKQAKFSQDGIIGLLGKYDIDVE